MCVCVCVCVCVCARIGESEKHRGERYGRGETPDKLFMFPGSSDHLINVVGKSARRCRQTGIVMDGGTSKSWDVPCGLWWGGVHLPQKAQGSIPHVCIHALVPLP